VPSSRFPRRCSFRRPRCPRRRQLCHRPFGAVVVVDAADLLAVPEEPECHVGRLDVLEGHLEHALVVLDAGEHAAVVFVDSHLHGPSFAPTEVSACPLYGRVGVFSVEPFERV
jgi:hypothetical protein